MRTGGAVGLIGTSIGFSMRGGGNDTQSFVVFLTVPCCAAASAVTAAFCVAAETTALLTLQTCSFVNLVALIATAQHVSAI